MRLAIIFGALSMLGVSAPVGPEDRYHVTDQEKAACTEDAARLCISAYPDEEKLLSCMKENRSSLSPVCLKAFDAGVKRRHL